MLSFRPGTRIFISTEPTDMRKGFDGLSAIVEHAWGDSPLSGDLFVFANRRCTLLKMIYWDDDGYAIWYKSQEQDNPSKFVFPGFAFSAHNGRIGTSGVGFLV